MMKIAVVGANSYIARNLICLMSKNPKIYDYFLYDCQDDHADGVLPYTKIDILNMDDVEKINFKCDLLFMFTGKTGIINGFEETDLFLNVNEHALLNILNAHRQHESKAKIIFPSTRLVYQGSHGKLGESAQKEFKSVYAINKYACEQYLRLYQNVYCVPYCIFRICVPYGTLVEQASSYGTAEFMLSKAKSGQNITLYGDGRGRRTLIYIEDLCRLLLMCAGMKECLNDVFNIGGEDYSLLEMANLIAKIYNVDIKFVPWPELALRTESGSTVFDSEKIEKIIGKFSYRRFEDWCQSEYRVI